MSTLLRYISISLLALALLVLVACGPAAAPTTAPQATNAPVPTAPPAPTAAPTTSPKPTTAPSSAADTLVYDRDISDLISLDPAVLYEFSGILIAHNAYETLVKFEGTDLTTPKPGLATKWDIKDSGDNWVLTFNLRTDAKFSSGNAVTADDVIYSFNRVLDLKKSPEFLFSADAKLTKDSMKAVDPQTVQITIPKTVNPQSFLIILTFTVGGVVDSKTVKAHATDNGGTEGEGWLLDHSAGSGPYIVDHWTKEAEVLLKANPNYNGTKPLLANVLIKHVAEPTNQQAALEKGDVDIANDLGSEQIKALQGKPGVTTTTADNLQLIYIGMNVKVPPLDNPKIREALRTAIDYDGIIKDLLSGNASKVQTIIPVGLLGANNDAPFQQDVNAAKQLLKDGGQPNGFSIDMGLPTGQAPGGLAWSDLAAKLQADWAKIGVTLNLKQTAMADMLGTYRAQKGQLIMVYWGPDYPDPDSNVGPFTEYAAKSVSWRNQWDDSTAASKAQAAALITDPTARTAAYKDLTEYVLHNGPYIIVYQPKNLFGLRSNVKGWAWSAIGWADFGVVSK